MNGWKITAIVFIVLFLFETATFVYIVNVGGKEIANEDKCNNEICDGYDAYRYLEHTCYCYKDNEVKLKKVMA